MSGQVEKKQEADFTAEVDTLLPQAQSLAKSGKLSEALEKLATLEKKARNAADLQSTTRLLLSSIALVRSNPSTSSTDWKLLEETLVSLTRKHGQLKQAVTRVVQMTMLYLYASGTGPYGSVTKAKSEGQGQEKDEEMKDATAPAAIALAAPAAPKTKTGVDGKKKVEVKTDKEIEEEERKQEEQRGGAMSEKVVELMDEARRIGDEGVDAEQRMKLVETLRTVTEGKIFVEVERARVTRILSDLLCAKGEVSKAADVLQELAVETFGSMSRREKTEFILEQMRLNLEREDYTRTAIVSKKINTKFFDEVEQQDLKLQYYDLMIRYALHERKHLDVSKYHRELHATPSVKKDEQRAADVLRNVIIFCVLSPYDNEQSDLMARVELTEGLDKVPEHRNLLKCFTTPELMRWPGIESLYGPLLRGTPAFGPDADGTYRWDELHKRVVEHNIRVISRYYTRITLARLGELLDLARAEAERSLADLVSAGTVYARIDRPAGVASFAKPRTDAETLEEWSGDMRRLLDYVETTSHLIHREQAIVRAGLTVKAD